MAVVLPNLPGVIGEAPELEVARMGVFYNAPAVATTLPTIYYPSGPQEVSFPTGKPPVINRGDNFPTYWMYSTRLEEWVNINYLFSSASFKHGQQLPNRVGGVMQPSEGAIYIKDDEGYLSPMNTAGVLDSGPGALIEIRKGNLRTGELLFKGWSRGVQIQTTDREPSFGLIRIYGPLARLSEFGEGFAARLDGHPVISEVIDHILDEMEWQGPRFISPSTIEVYASRLNRKDILDRGLRQRANFMGAMRELAVLEGGLVYDYAGAFYFESFVEPRGLRRDPGSGKFINPVEVKQLESDRLILNIIEEQADNWVSRGEKPLNFVGMVFPQSFTIAPFTDEYRIDLFLEQEGDENEQFLESFQQLVRNTHYTYTLGSIGGRPVEPVVSLFSGGLSISIANPSAETQTFTIVQLRGELFKKAWTARIGERRGQSILHYGPKAAVYRGDLVVDQAAMRRRAQYWLDEWGGIDRQGNPIPPLAMEAIVENPTDTYKVSDLVRMNWGSLFFNHCIQWPFWVESVEVKDNGLEVNWNLTLSDAYRKALTISEPATDPDTGEEVRLIEQIVARMPVGEVSSDAPERIIAAMTVETSSNIEFELVRMGLDRIDEFEVGRLTVDTEYPIARMFREFNVASMPVERLVANMPVDVPVVVARMPLEYPVAKMGVEREVARMPVEREVVVARMIVDPVEFVVARLGEIEVPVARMPVNQAMITGLTEVSNTYTTITLRAAVTNPAGTLYYRYREEGTTGAFTSRSTTPVAANTDFTITRLKLDTSYDVEVSLNADFGAETTGTFKTRPPMITGISFNRLPTVLNRVSDYNARTVIISKSHALSPIHFRYKRSTDTRYTTEMLTGASTVIRRNLTRLFTGTTYDVEASFNSDFTDSMTGTFTTPQFYAAGISQRGSVVRSGGEGGRWTYTVQFNLTSTPFESPGNGQTIFFYRYDTGFRPGFGSRRWFVTTTPYSVHQNLQGGQYNGTIRATGSISGNILTITLSTTPNPFAVAAGHTIAGGSVNYTVLRASSTEWLVSVRALTTTSFVSAELERLRLSGAGFTIIVPDYDPNA